MPTIYHSLYIQTHNLLANIWIDIPYTCIIFYVKKIMEIWLIFFIVWWSFVALAVLVRCLTMSAERGGHRGGGDAADSGGGGGGGGGGGLGGGGQLLTA